jgi:hypothetical protein
MTGRASSPHSHYDNLVITIHAPKKGVTAMKTRVFLIAGLAFGLLSLAAVPVRPASAQLVFQAAGPTAASIQGTIDAYRAALGDPNNANNSGPLADGRREINWDGGGSDVTTDPVTPFNVFLNSRGAQFTTPGTGLSQAPPSGGPQGGLATLFDNPSYGTTFGTFTAPRLFTPVGSRITEGLFFVPDSNPANPRIPAAVKGFGAVFTDVDKPDGRDKQGRKTLIQYFDAGGGLLFSGFVPSAPGDASLSFFGIVLADPLIARVRIKTGDVAPGPDDDKKDIVVMDDFIYGEPQPLP